MHKKIFLFFFFLFIFTGNNCFAAINLEVPLPASPTLPGYIAYFFLLAIILGGILAVLSLVISGIQLIYSSGSPVGVSEAKKRATSAILGLILLLSSFILIRTINPKLENLDPEEGLRPNINTFYFSGSNPTKTAPMTLETLSSIKQDGYEAIGWNANYCDTSNPNLVYNIYWYKEPNFKNLFLVTRLQCGLVTENIIPQANSYLIVKETPGVYFYESLDCMPPFGSNNNSIPVAHIQGITEDAELEGKKIQSIRIVNGPNPFKGPFFGLVYFNSTDYRTGEFSYGLQHFLFNPSLPENNKINNNSRCFSGNQLGNGKGLPSKGSSFVIYKWVGFKEDGSGPAKAGSGITLHTEVSWSGGLLDLATIPENAWRWSYALVNQNSPLFVYYPPNSNIPKEKRDLCKIFNPVNSCLKSFEIKGNYLVLLSPIKIQDYYFMEITKAQAFPMPSRLQEAYKNRPSGYSVERGSPELDTDYIGSKNIYFIEVIPLAERFK